MHSISLIFNGEPVYICFKSLQTGLQIAQILKNQQNNIVNQQKEDQLMRKYVQSISQFAIQQPLFVDMSINQVDQRLEVNEKQVVNVRTNIISQNQQIAQILQQKPVQSTIQQQQYSKQATPITQTKATQSQTVAIQQNTQQSQNLQEQTYKLVYQILIYVFTKDPILLMQASLQTGIKIDNKNDPQQLANLVKATTHTFMHYPLQEMLLRLQEYQNIPKEMQDKIQELSQAINQQNQQQPIQPNQKIERVPQVLVAKPTISGVILQTSEQSKIDQACQLLVQLEPHRISHLIHSIIPKLPRIFNYQIVNSNKFIINGQFQNVSFNQLLSLNLRLTKSQKQYFTNETEFSIKIQKFYEKQYVQHQVIFNKDQYVIYHRQYSQEENLLILHSVYQQLINIFMKQRQLKHCKLYNFDSVITQAQKITYIKIFDQLQRLIEVQKQQNIKQAFSNPNKDNAPKEQSNQQNQQQVNTSIVCNVNSANQQQPVVIPQRIQFVPQEVKNSITDIFYKALSSVDSNIIAKAILIIVGLGSSLQFNAPFTYAFLENNINYIYKTNPQFGEVSREKLFIIITGLIPCVVRLLKLRVVNDRVYQQMYMSSDKLQLCTFSQYYDSYCKECLTLNKLKDSNKQLMVTHSESLHLIDSDICEILRQNSDTIKFQVIEKIGITRENQQVKEEAEQMQQLEQNE